MRRTKNANTETKGDKTPQKAAGTHSQLAAASLCSPVTGVLTSDLPARRAAAASFCQKTETSGVTSVSECDSVWWDVQDGVRLVLQTCDPHTSHCDHTINTDVSLCCSDTSLWRSTPPTCCCLLPSRQKTSEQPQRSVHNERKWTCRHAAVAALCLRELCLQLISIISMLTCYMQK